VILNQAYLLDLQQTRQSILNPPGNALKGHIGPALYPYDIAVPFCVSRETFLPEQVFSTSITLGFVKI
jgi:hypothetical protein